MSLNLHISNDLGYKFAQEKIRSSLEKTLTDQGLKSDLEIGLFVVDSETMADLHARFMETREPTDVLSFPLLEKEMIENKRGIDPDGVMRLGDIVICFEVAQRQANENNKSTDEEIEFLANHGCLHLLGIHHEE